MYFLPRAVIGKSTKKSIETNPKQSWETISQFYLNWYNGCTFINVTHLKMNLETPIYKLGRQECSKNLWVSWKFFRKPIA